VANFHSRSGVARLPATLSTKDIVVISAACDRARDRILFALFALLAETEMRVDQLQTRLNLCVKKVERLSVYRPSLA